MTGLLTSIQWCDRAVPAGLIGMLRAPDDVEDGTGTQKLGRVTRLEKRSGLVASCLSSLTQSASPSESIRMR